MEHNNGNFDRREEENVLNESAPSTSAFDTGLDRRAANFAPLTPLTFLARSADVFPHKTAVIHGDLRLSYGELYARCRQFASALAKRGIGRNETVSIIAPNIPALLEAHYGPAMVGAVLNPINIRLDPATIAFTLEHAQSKLFIVDREFNAAAKEAIALMASPPPVIDIDDPMFDVGAGDRANLIGDTEYEGFLAEGDPDFEWRRPSDEWDAISLNYTSGTTGNPKGVVVHHRGAYLNGLGQVLVHGLRPDSRYLWTLPMFHCNGWTYTWGVTAIGGTHVCLRRVESAPIFAAIADNGITHMCGAPIVLNMLANSDAEDRRPFDQLVDVATGGAAPPSAVISAMEAMGFHVTHLYGTTEAYGPATVCAWRDEWDELPADARAEKTARQGVRYPTLEEVEVLDPETMEPVPHDGETIGEIMLRGNTVMKGYLKNPEATEAAFMGDWYHSGDLAVVYPDGYIEVKDRSKDIIISGGENISTLEVESVLYRHPAVLEAAVVARPDEKWGETPCAFVTLKQGAEVGDGEIIDHCRNNMARFKVPKTIVFGPLPKTSTGKVQKYELRERARGM
ncbi:MAG: acyl-CoA synthetase [Alphaproteobacteria bacterium]|nr:acyl-CoA synthetase [Alphaproteobacteria bacterium]